MKIFSTNEVKKILEYLSETYFKHYRLYHHILTNKQYNETKNIINDLEDHNYELETRNAELERELYLLQ